MKKFTKIICVLMLSFTMLLLLGCESIKGPQGRYVFKVDRMINCSLTFEDDKVTINYEGKDMGIFDYTYEKSKDDVDKGTVVIDSEECPWTFTFDYEEKKLRCDINGDKIIDVFTKLEE